MFVKLNVCKLNNLRHALYICMQLFFLILDRLVFKQSVYELTACLSSIWCWQTQCQITYLIITKYINY